MCNNLKGKIFLLQLLIMNVLIYTYLIACVCVCGGGGDSLLLKRFLIPETKDQIMSFSEIVFKGNFGIIVMYFLAFKMKK